MHFFCAMNPPTTTHQQKAVRVVGGRPQFYEPPAVLDARQKLSAHLSKHRPECPISGAIRLGVKWCFPRHGSHRDGEYRTTKPDTDNLQKLLKDVMTDLEYWHDDAQVACEFVEKFWADTPGIFVSVEAIS